MGLPAYMLKNYRSVCSDVYRRFKVIDKYARVFVFGSVLSGEVTASSDIDILILENYTEKIMEDPEDEYTGELIKYSPDYRKRI